MIHEKLAVLSPWPRRRSPWLSLPCDPGPSLQGQGPSEAAGGSPRLGGRASLDWGTRLSSRQLRAPCGMQLPGHPTPFRLQERHPQPPELRGELILTTGGKRAAGTSHPRLCTTLSSLQLGHPGHGEDPTLQPCPKPSAPLGPLEPLK